MTEIYKTAAFDSALYPFESRIKNILFSLPGRIKAGTEEIRLRAGKPLVLTVCGAPMFVSENSVVGLYPSGRPIIVTNAELKEIYLRLCNYSVYTHQEEIKSGYIMMKNGHRAGVCGNFAPNGTLCDVFSVNIRIAKQILGCADKLVNRFSNGMLIAGPPGSGKTTLLRDAVRSLSKKCGMRVSVIDTRGEIAALSGGVAYNDIGPNTDVITGIEKAKGIEMAVRTLNPSVVAFDEIGTVEEIEAVVHTLNSGAAVLTTAHIGNEDDLYKREIIKKLLSSKAVSDVALLTSPGKEIVIKSVKRMCTV